MGTISPIGEALVGGFTIYALLEFDAEGRATHRGYVVYSESGYEGSFASFRAALAFVKKALAIASEFLHFRFNVLHNIVTARLYRDLQRELESFEAKLRKLEIEQVARTKQFRDFLKEACANPIDFWTETVTLLPQVVLPPEPDGPGPCT